MARVHDFTITNGLSGRLVPGRWGSITESYPSRAAPAEPSRAQGEVRSVGVTGPALEGRAVTDRVRRAGRLAK